MVYTRFGIMPFEMIHMFVHIPQSPSQEQTHLPQRIMVVWVECFEELVSWRVTQSIPNAGILV